jgi:hypothetical protein
MKNAIELKMKCPHCKNHGIPVPFKLAYRVWIGEEIEQVNFDGVCPQCGEKPNLDRWVLHEAYDINADAVEYAREFYRCQNVSVYSDPYC